MPVCQPAAAEAFGLPLPLPVLVRLPPSTISFELVFQLLLSRSSSNPRPTPTRAGNTNCLCHPLPTPPLFSPRNHNNHHSPNITSSWCPQPGSDIFADCLCSKTTTRPSWSHIPGTSVTSPPLRPSNIDPSGRHITQLECISPFQTPSRVREPWDLDGIVSLPCHLRHRPAITLCSALVGFRGST